MTIQSILVSADTRRHTSGMDSALVSSPELKHRSPRGLDYTCLDLLLPDVLEIIAPAPAISKISDSE